MRFGNRHVPSAGDQSAQYPDAVPPAQQFYVGRNNPYRGTETHGVDPMPDAFSDELNDMVVDAEDAEWHAAPEEIEPIPVRVVRESSDEFRAFAVAQLPVSNQPTQISPWSREKIAADFKHCGPADTLVYIGHNSTVNDKNGYPLTLGQTYRLESVEPVWMYGVSQNVVNVAVITYYTLDPTQK